jgi:hypothetical protein
MTGALESHGWPANFVEATKLPYVYVDLEAIEAAQVDPDEVLGSLAEAIAVIEGIERVIVTGELQADPELDELELRVARNQFPGRSGELYVVRKPGWQQSNPSGPFNLLQHGSGWDYDSFVPLGFAGPGVAVGVHERDDVHSVDLMPTLAVLLGTQPGEEVAGQVLQEVFATGPKAKGPKTKDPK